LRERVEELRRRAVLRLAVLRLAVVLLLVRELFAAPVARLAAGRFALILRAADARVPPALADFARDGVFLFAAVLRVPVERFAVERLAVALRAPVLRDAPELVLIPPSIVHLPDITRWAASATASAMIEPSLVALETTLVAA
jgi:hypothetical protein